jgi:branched-chain amino acid transport system permease protein
MIRARIPPVVAAAAAGLVLLAGPAFAQDDGQEVKGTLEKIDAEAREPVAGVTMTVTQDGVGIGSAVSDEAGRWVVPVPEPGTYQVRIEVDTLPDGIALTDPEKQELPDVLVRNGQSKTVRFQLGPGIVAEAGGLGRFVDLFVLGLKLGAIIALSAVGLSLVFGVTGLVNFAHGELVTFGAVIAFWLNASSAGPEWQLLLAAVPALVIAGAFGGMQEVWLWRPLRRRQTSLVAVLVVSIGLSFILRYLILIFMGGLPRPFSDYVIQDEISFLGISTVPKNIVIIVGTAVVLGVIGLFLQRTKMGTAMRAVADNRDLAESSGINVERVMLVTWIVGASLAALGGILFGVSETVQWDMGFRLLLLIFAAVVLGGLGTAYGAMVGGFAIGVLVEVSTFWIDVDMKTAVALGALVLMLIVRPQGLLGVKERVA